EGVVREAERDRQFARRLAIASRRVRSLQQKSRHLKRHAPQLKPEIVERLQRQLWELGEQVRVEAFAAGEQA
ncbi:MAG TPA: hypothetical protein VKT29_03070, partial [Terriglobales bacterium]|nr:hypothetical protein [Terriglobales bacterium]